MPILCSVEIFTSTRFGAVNTTQTIKLNIEWINASTINRNVGVINHIRSETLNYLRSFRLKLLPSIDGELTTAILALCILMSSHVIRRICYRIYLVCPLGRILVGLVCDMLLLDKYSCDLRFRCIYLLYLVIVL